MTDETPRRQPLREHYRENGNQNPCGNGSNHGAGGHHGQELKRDCPFCGEEIASNHVHTHLPCEGVR